jgi:GNAT superfamily N-acetyltransferase
MPTIRPARLNDLERLAAVERSAASVFRDAGLAWIAEGETLAAESLAAMQENEMLWVAVDEGDLAVGFLGALVLDQQFHITELSVVRRRQKQGLGAALMTTADTRARDRRFRLVTLITYRDLPWNGPFYAKLGFTEIAAAAVGPQHVQTLLGQAAAGHDPLRRCVMAKSTDSARGQAVTGVSHPGLASYSPGTNSRS